MAAADIDDKQSLVPPPPSPSPQGVLRPTISSTRRSSRSPSACLGGLSLNFRVPSLPKLHRKGPLVSTKLCETVCLNVFCTTIFLRTTAILDARDFCTEAEVVHRTCVRPVQLTGILPVSGVQQFTRPSSQGLLLSQGYEREAVKKWVSM